MLLCKNITIKWKFGVDVNSKAKKKTFFIFRKAKLLLRKKRFQESTLSKTDGQLNNIEQMV